MKTAGSPRISIIIPVFHEADRIGVLLDSLRALDPDHITERIVVEGAPEGDTLSAVHDPDAVVIRSARGRARQMNAGAEIARGDILLFLHADTFLPSEGFETVLETMADETVAAGAFGIRFDSERTVFKVFGWLDSKRSRITRVPYGDQAVFLRRDFFWSLGGYGDLPIMEDVDLLRRIKKRRGRVCVLKSRVTSSVRRWEREGLVYCTARNLILLLLFRLGVPPSRLKRYYRDDPTDYV